MSQRIKDGIIIDNSYYIIEDKKAGFPYYMRLLQLLAVIAAGWSVISVFVETFLIPVNSFYINMAVLITGGILFSILLFPSYDIIKAVFAVGFYGLFIYSRFPRLQNGFYILENLILQRFDEYYGYHNDLFVADYLSTETDTTLLVIMILIPMMTLIAIAVVRSRWINICNVILFIPIAASFAFGFIPSERFLITYLMCMLFLTKSYISGHKTSNKEQKTILHRVNIMSAIWLSMVCLVIFSLMKLIITPDQYDEVTKIKEVKSELQTFLYDFSVSDVANRMKSNRLISKNEAVGGLSGGELGKVDRITYNETVQLNVTAPITSVSEGIYLKGYVGSEYTGSSWEGHSDEIDRMYEELMEKLPKDQFVPANQNIRFFSMISEFKNNSNYQYSFYQGKIKVDYVRADKKYMYAPYYTDYSALEEIEYRQDLYPAPKEKKSDYEFDYFYEFSAEEGGSPFLIESKWKDEEYSEYEKLYRDFVYEAYTKLPEKGLDRIKRDFADVEGENTPEAIMDKINYIKDYLKNETDYSLAPGSLPDGEDFVEYFLYENKVGYCSHYASAAALMLRAMGIPSRYVEGYAFGALNINEDKGKGDQLISVYTDKEDFKQVTQQVELSVRDSNAHAWVEVYIDGCGWIPIEFTPAIGYTDTTAMAEDLMVIGEDMDETLEPTITPTDVPVTPTEEPEITGNHTAEEPEADTGPSDMKPAKKQTLLVWLLVIVPVFLLGAIGIALSVYKYKILMRTKNNRKRALLLYKDIEKMISFSGSLPGKRAYLEDYEEYVRENCIYLEKDAFDSCMEAVKRVRFGKNMPATLEVKRIEEFHHNLYHRIYESLNFIRKIYLKLMLLM